MAWNYIPGSLLRDPDLADRLGEELHQHFAPIFEPEDVIDYLDAELGEDELPGEADPARPSSELVAELFGNAIGPYLPGNEDEERDGDR